MPRTDGAVCVYQGQALFAHLNLATPALDLSGAFTAFVPTETGYLFPSMAAHGDAVLLVGQGHQLLGAFGVIVRPGHVPQYLGAINPVAGVVNPVAVRPVVDGWEVAVVIAPDRVQLLHVSTLGGWRQTATRPIPSTSQGITGWDGDELILGDPPHRLIKGRALSEATYVGPWWVGQDTHRGNVVLVHGPSGAACLVHRSQVAQRPRLAILPDGRFAITASEDFAWSTVVAQADLLLDPTIGMPVEGPAPTPDPTPVPGPGPIPDPTEPPMPSPSLIPDDVYATIRAVVARYPHTGSDDDRRTAMQKLVQTVRARHGLSWVWKSEHGGNLATGSKDALARTVTPQPAHGERLRMDIWDVINGTTRAVVANHLSEHREAYALVLEPWDWLQAAPPAPPVPGPTPGPAPDPAPAPDLAVRVRVLEQELALQLARLDEQASINTQLQVALAATQVRLTDLQQRVEDLAQQPPAPAPAPPLPALVATGTVSLSDALYGRRLVWAVTPRP